MPFVDLGESDLEASNASLSTDADAQSGAYTDSIDNDKARLAEVNRMIKSYESQLPKIGGGGANSSAGGTASASNASINTDEPDQSYEDDYNDDEFAESGAVGEQIEESIEVEEDIIDGSKVDDSLDDAEYFHSSASASGMSATKDGSSVGGVKARLTQLPSAAASYDNSDDFVEDDRDPEDVYSQDASVNEPLENEYDYTEEAIAVGR